MDVAISISASYLMNIIKEANNTDKFFQHVEAGLQQQEIPHKFEHYKLEYGTINYKNMVYIPNSKNVNKTVLK